MVRSLLCRHFLMDKERSTSSANQVGWHYYYGEGVERDYSEAVKWFFMAADKDCAEAYFYLGMCVMEGKGVVADPEEARR